MKNQLRIAIKKTPLINTAARIMLTLLGKWTFPGSKRYWEQRYTWGGTSGPGSQGRLAEFKAEIINSFVKNNKINSVIDFGCGDGNQLSLFNFRQYIGLDVSEKAIRLCRERFKNDKSKRFSLYDPEHFNNHSLFKADLALSLDVIYHLVEDHPFELYMRHLFSAAKKYVIIYSPDTENPIFILPHCKSRQFSKWIEINLPEWKLIKKIKNRYPNESDSDFFIYKKIK